MKSESINLSGKFYNMNNHFYMEQPWKGKRICFQWAVLGEVILFEKVVAPTTAWVCNWLMFVCQAPLLAIPMLYAGFLVYRSRNKVITVDVKSVSSCLKLLMSIILKLSTSLLLLKIDNVRQLSAEKTFKSKWSLSFVAEADVGSLHN